uniref:lysozyme n=1 Tax=Patella vulgata TaxID=6465 RepID=A0A7D5D3I9_PATVU|nr:pedal mucus protein 9 [Patella vulgata]
MLAYVCLVALFTFAAVESKVFSRCELAKELVRVGVPRSDVHHWVCMAQYESSLNTAAQSPPNSDNSRDHGLFQINDYWNCDNGNGRTKNGCNKRCSVFRDDNLTDDVACIKQLKREHGNTYNFSYAYRDNCLGQVTTSFLGTCSY